MSDPKPPTNPTEKLEELRRGLSPEPAESGAPAYPSRGQGAPRLVTPGGRPARQPEYRRPAPRYVPEEEYVDDGFERLQAENTQLREFLDEIKPILEEAERNEQRFTALQEKATEELQVKDVRIKELEEQVAEIEQQIEAGDLVPRPKTRSELEEWADELERESAQLNMGRQHLEEERAQLRDDEESLEKQMREMELQMARERALLARQETELKRLNAEIQRELELMQRGDVALREQMAKFQRRHQEVTTQVQHAAVHSAPPPGVGPTGPSNPTPPPKDSSLLKRFFGRE